MEIKSPYQIPTTGGYQCSQCGEWVTGSHTCIPLQPGTAKITYTWGTPTDLQRIAAALERIAEALEKMKSPAG